MKAVAVNWLDAC